MKADRKALISEAAPVLADWYRENGRALPWRQDRDAYKIWISEIMLQQTRIEAVKPYYARFMEELPDLSALAQVEEDRLLKLWEGLGYYSRARNLKKCAMEVTERWGGQLPADYEALKRLPGIGPYTAGAIASMAYGIPVPAVDGNVLRVLSRLLADSADIGQASVKREAERLLTDCLPKDRPGDFNEGIMELGETICIPNGRPSCNDCPLKTLCLAVRQGIQEELPVKTPKRARRREQRTVLLLQYETESSGLVTGIRKRPEDGLLAGLYELPSLPGEMTQEEIRRTLSERGVDAREIREAGKARHIFSHVEWDMTGYVVRLDRLPDPGDLIFVEKAQVKEDYALPAAFRAFRKYL
ncbi:MAG: A/G-specific adenine glycosylase [Lachnospiraceae bacterium]|nr:A/G-specific adenine glycosylase [Lachnospiraceae bacterium]